MAAQIEAMPRHSAGKRLAWKIWNTTIEKYKEDP